MTASEWPAVPLRSVLQRRKQQLNIVDEERYKRVTIRLYGNGVSVRDEVPGSEIGTKKQFYIRKGQFLLSKIDALNGAFGVVDQACDGSIITGNFWAFDVDESLLSSRYFYFVTRTPGFVDFCVRASSGTTNRRYLQESKFLSQQIALPPLEEQQRIVTKIDSMVAKIDDTRLMAEQVESGWRALARSEFARIISVAPREKMAKVAPLVRRKTEPRFGEEYPELGIRSFGKGTFHKPPLDYLAIGSKKLYRIAPGDLVFNNVFAWEGAIAVAQPEDEGRFGSHRFITCHAQEGHITPEFLCFYFLTPEGLEKIGEASPGGAGRNRTLGLEKLSEIEVPIANYEQQMQFGRLLQRVRKMQLIKHAAGIELDALLPSILDRAFKGAL